MRKSGGQCRGAERRGTVEGRFEKCVYRRVIREVRL